MTDQNHLNRINALTSNARQTWFALLAALIFVGVTLMSVEHIDFYGVGRATTLPIVNFDVPTNYFFYAAPILIAAIYGYFHLYLIRLWDALGHADAGTADNRLGDAVTPWLVTDAALMLRLRRRADGCTTHRTLELSAMVLNTMLAWVFGLTILAFLWWMSMPARDWVMTGIAAVSLLLSAITGYVSLRLMWLRMGPRDSWPKIHVTSEMSYNIGMILLVPAVLIVSHSRTVEPSEWISLAPIEMIDEAIVERPAGWLPHDIARADFLGVWCARESAPCQRDDLSEAQRRAFDAEWKTRRATGLTDMRRPVWHRLGRKKPDFRDARLESSFLAGTNLREARMDGADLSSAQLEGADLTSAEMKGADLFRAQMAGADMMFARLQGARIADAQLEGAVLFQAQMQEAELFGARLQGADLGAAQLENANFSNALLQGANLSRARLQGATFIEAQLKDADLFLAQMRGARLIGAQLDRANLSRTDMRGVNLFEAQMKWANLSGAQMGGAELREAQMQNAILNGTNLHQADLRGAKMHETDLYGAEMYEARLQEAQITEADLRETQLIRAVLDFSLLSGGNAGNSVFERTNLSESTNNGGAVRYLDLTGARYDSRTNWRNVFLDGSVAMTPAFRRQMGAGSARGPCQWVDEVLDDTEFYGRWRGWVEAAPDDFAAPQWYQIAPERFQDVTAIPPDDPNCIWKTEPIRANEVD